MIKTAITSSIVPQARQGPFVFHDDLPASIIKIGQLGFDAIEIFPPSANAIDVSQIQKMTADANLKVAAVGTGAGFVVYKLTLSDPDPAARLRAVNFVKEIIDIAGALGAPAIIGSMQGRHPEGQRDASLSPLAESLETLGTHARQYKVPLLYEPLNRYETNLFNRQGEAADWLRGQRLQNIKILADLFHMNIEEVDVAGALRQVGDLLGHVHFVDSNRRACGLGHTDFTPIVRALHDIKYEGYASAECFPFPDSESAAKQTIDAYHSVFN